MRITYPLSPADVAKLLGCTRQHVCHMARWIGLEPTGPKQSRHRRWEFSRQDLILLRNQPARDSRGVKGVRGRKPKPVDTPPA